MISRTRAVAAVSAACGLVVALSWATMPAAESSPLVRPAQQATAKPPPTPVPTKVPVGGKIQAPNACYVRLRDMPPVRSGGGTGRFGMFAGFNPTTGVLSAAGGAVAITARKSLTLFEMYAVKLDSPFAQWQEVGYSSDAGWTREAGAGCREAASVQVSDELFVSVGGTGGCDSGRFDTRTKRGGDLRQIVIGSTADTTGVNFVPGSGADRLVWDLASRTGTLRRHFATFDHERHRLIFGQGTFNNTRESETHPEVYMAHVEGSKFHLMVLQPTGIEPDRRYGSCGAYVHNKALGLDGVLVLGGRQGGPPNTGKHTDKELWWLDFSRNEFTGEWTELTPRVTNNDAIGVRYDGACAYDHDTKKFYSWMGGADAKIPQGAANSSGAWRLDVTNLADPNGTLTWERLAPDNLRGVTGRTQIPNVWDAVNKRMFVIGGKVGQSTNFNDVWAIYPDVTGDQCTNLNPYAPYAPANPTATPIRPPTATPETLTLTPEVCPRLTGLVPDAVIAAALASPETVQGWGLLQNPGLPASMSNPYRTRLTLQNPSTPYSPNYNSIVYMAGCS